MGTDTRAGRRATLTLLGSPLAVSGLLVLDLMFKLGIMSRTLMKEDDLASRQESRGESAGPLELSTSEQRLEYGLSSLVRTT